MEQWYGWLAGALYSVPYSLTGLVMGALTHRVNRKLTLGIAMILSGVCQFFTGAFNSFHVLMGMRALHGSMNSATNPLSYSLIADYIPPEKRATANSVLSSAHYVGIAFSSMSILLIKQIGWRYFY